MWLFRKGFLCQTTYLKSVCLFVEVNLSFLLHSLSIRILNFVLFRLYSSYDLKKRTTQPSSDIALLKSRIYKYVADEQDGIKNMKIKSDSVPKIRG